MNSKQNQLAESKTRLFEKIEKSGVLSGKTIKALKSVNRENYVREELISQAYDDTALPIAAGQTISQVLVVGIMVEALDLNWEDKLLEVGTGCGYVVAVLSKLNRRVFSVERIKELVEDAERNLSKESNNNYTIVHSDGFEGFSQQAPFDKILVSAACPEVPKSLLDQLNIGGTMILPLGIQAENQQLTKIVKTKNSYEEFNLGAVRFVPMVKGVVT
ncbi:MAG: protein-L-isoaspartate(D-aspartate) O-methyltransferase [Proteobacteria bacterium]|nr:protein-L-isoaspartate(D-aspartate) O-methyltransferase [Pseudomonadota bacterium]